VKAVILAAGKGSRLAEYTGGMPKCLLTLGNETILEREIRVLQECGIEERNIYVVGGYKYEMLQKYTSNLIINDQYDTKDNSYTLGLALKTIDDDDILILDADLCFDTQLISEILLDHNKNVLMSKASSDLEESTGIVTNKNGQVQAIGKQYINTGYVYLSVFKIDRHIIPEFRDALLSPKSEKTWYPLAITELCKKYEFYNHVTKAKWHEIDFVEDYEETVKLFGLEDMQ
jgi:choline kinase